MVLFNCSHLFLACFQTQPLHCDRWMPGTCGNVSFQAAHNITYKPVESRVHVLMFAKLTFELKEFPGKKGRAISRTDAAVCDLCIVRMHCRHSNAPSWKARDRFYPHPFSKQSASKNSRAFELPEWPAQEGTVTTVEEVSVMVGGQEALGVPGNKLVNHSSNEFSWTSPYRTSKLVRELPLDWCLANRNR